ncbi:MAG: hypothetical protein L0216_13745 [Planctomycetales bacterium]|nr:hypothetical protein [Planctomycetales bacterium]
MASPQNGKRLIGLAAWLGTATGTGLVAALLLGTRPETLVLTGGETPPPSDGSVRPLGAPDRSSPDRSAPGSHGTVGSGRPVGPGGPGMPGGPGAAGDPGIPGPDTGASERTGEGAVAGWIELTIRRADRTPAQSGTVYVLPPGEPGTDDLDEIPHATLDEEGRALVPVPVAGAWDVGYAGEGQVLLPDVRVGPGETARLGVALPDARPIRFRIQGEAPPSGTWVISVTSEGSGGEEVAYPGRRQVGAISTTTWFDDAGKGETEPLPPGRRFQIVVGEQTGTAKSWLEPSAETAAAGDEVTLRPAPLPQLALRIRREGLPPEAEVSLQLSRAFEATWGSVERIGERDSYPVEHLPPFLDLALGPGRAKVLWSGSGVESGATDEFRLECGRTVVREIIVRAQPQAEEATPSLSGEQPAKGARWTLQVLLPDGAPVGEGRTVFVLAALPGPPPRTEYFGCDSSSPEVDLTEGWPAVREVLAVLGPGLASEPVTVGTDGRVRIALRPGGLLAVVPERLQAPGLGALTIEREDGRPIPVAYAGDSSGTTEESWQMAAASLSPRIGLGTILGPFPEGPIRFRVRVGRRLVAEIPATVKAGAIRPLVIPR